ncbi:MAG: hypothetical protein LBF95_05910, partial [Treponema sp.]|nr:hypothetical protein [Treponema sp.]
NERGSGIYEVKGEPYRVQVVVTEELEGEVEWLRELRGGLKAEELRVILEKADEMPAGSPVSAYKDRILQANEDAVKELRMSTRGFDKLMEEWGLAAKWEARGRKAAAAEYAEQQRQAQEQIKQAQERHQQTQEQIRRLEEENRRLREGLSVPAGSGGRKG